MKRVLVLGAGLVSRPVVRYLLETAGYRVTVTSLQESEAIQLVDGHANGVPLQLQISDSAALDALVKDADLVISLLPFVHHPTVAKVCLIHGKNLVTTSYVSPEMRALDQQARDKGLLFLNEIGLDPGLDHMSAMKVIHQVQKSGAVVESFRSYCGGLPAPDADNNPWGYKFSWSPRGVVLAARNPARYIQDGEVVDILAWDLFACRGYLKVEGLGTLEGYANRDSTGYRELYGLQDVKTLYRGTLRNPGHCSTWLAIARSGLLDLDQRTNMADKTYAEFMAGISGSSRSHRAREVFALKCRLPYLSDPMNRLEWLGMFSQEDRIGVETISPLDVLSNRLEQKLHYQPGERDMIVLCHEFISEKDGKRELITSQLVNYGVSNGDTAMSRTVSLPAAIASHMVCEGKIGKTGVHIPVDPEIYEPVLDGLAKQGIVCNEARRSL